jgi:hypothetical protein
MLLTNTNRRSLTIIGLASALVLVWTARLLLLPSSSASSFTWHPAGFKSSSSGLSVPPHRSNYFEQVFSASKPSPFPYATLKEQCDHAEWVDDAPYLKCVGIVAGLTSIISQVKVCLKMAVESGSNLVLPTMPLRDSGVLQNFNFLNESAYMPYDEWFDDEHLRNVMSRACPKMKIVHPAELEVEVPVKHHAEISMGDAPGYTKISSYFWTGRPFRAFFEEQYRSIMFLHNLDPNRDPNEHGITVVDIDSEFLLFRITDDPTGHDMRLWNDISHLIRFRDQPRQIVARLMAKLTRPYYGVHFRVENDTIWSSLEHQLGVDLDALDRAWTKFGSPGQQKPLVYLACGDAVQVEKFVVAGAERGWEVTHKWRLAEDDPETISMINELPFDFQGAVDMGVMIPAEFFIGITGSALSYTVAHQRDVLGRYRGSSFDVWDDEGAGTHLAFEGDTEYVRCL